MRGNEKSHECIFNHRGDIVLSCAGNALFGRRSGAVRFRYQQAQNRAHRGSKASKLAAKLKARPEWYISTALIGSNLAIIIASTLATALLISFYGPSRGKQIAFMFMIPTLFLMIIVRSLFLNYAEAMAVRVAWFIRFSSILFLSGCFCDSDRFKGNSSSFLRR